MIQAQEMVNMSGYGNGSYM